MSQPVIPADGEIVLNDGGTLELVLVYEDGDFSSSGDRPDAKQTTVFKKRGTVYSVRQTEDIDGVDVSFTCHVVRMTGTGGNATPRDACLFEGDWSAAVSTNPSGDAKMLQIAWSADNGTAMGLTYKYFMPESVDFSEGIPAKFSFKGKAMKMASDWKTVS